MSEEPGGRTYRDILADSTPMLVAFVWGIALLSMLWFVATGKLAVAGVIDQRTMIGMRVPAVVLTAVVWVWALQRQFGGLLR